MATQQGSTSRTNSFRIAMVVEADSIDGDTRSGKPGLNARISEAIVKMEEGGVLDLVDVRVTTTYNQDKGGFKHVATILANCTPAEETDEEASQ